MIRRGVKAVHAGAEVFGHGGPGGLVGDLGVGIRCSGASGPMPVWRFHVRAPVGFTIANHPGPCLHIVRLYY